VNADGFRIFAFDAHDMSGTTPALEDRLPLSLMFDIDHSSRSTIPMMATLLD